ncbi:hypothetical protein, partial [Acinetobacter sp. WCHAc060025]|uniref:hypothetical protein n=1 Tax=Acinetobacter sp. WCHAc060025 TaxID=2518625 RepID=UPI001BC87B25
YAISFYSGHLSLRSLLNFTFFPFRRSNFVQLPENYLLISLNSARSRPLLSSFFWFFKAVILTCDPHKNFALKAVQRQPMDSPSERFFFSVDNHCA